MKIIKTEKYSQTYEEALPYRVDFAKEQRKAQQMTTEELFFALKDAIDASKISSNAGKYTDQASVYRRELERRGFSIIKQDERLLKTPSLHS